MLLPGASLYTINERQKACISGAFTHLSPSPSTPHLISRLSKCSCLRLRSQWGPCQTPRCLYAHTFARAYLPPAPPRVDQVDLSGQRSTGAAGKWRSPKFTVMTKCGRGDEMSGVRRKRSDVQTHQSKCGAAVCEPKQFCKLGMCSGNAVGREMCDRSLLDELLRVT